MILAGKNTRYVVLNCRGGLIYLFRATLVVIHTKMTTVNRLSLDEIISGGFIRFTEDGLVYAVDLVMAVTGKNNDDAGKDLRSLPKEIFSPERFTERKTPGKGNSKTKLISFQDAIELIMVLPGRSLLCSR